jgi:hypothetical protein
MIFNTASSGSTVSEDAEIANLGQLRLRLGLSDALTIRLDLIHNSVKAGEESSVADPDPGSGAFLTPGSGSRMGKTIRIRDPQ